MSSTCSIARLIINTILPRLFKLAARCYLCVYIEQDTLSNGASKALRVLCFWFVPCIQLINGVICSVKCCGTTPPHFQPQPNKKRHENRQHAPQLTQGLSEGSVFRIWTLLVIKTINDVDKIPIEMG